MQLQTVVIDTLNFTVNGFTKTLCMEHSDTGNANLFCPLYDDACDVGFTLRNPATGHTTRWFQDETHRREGEVTHWTFKPTSETLLKYPRLEGWTVIIFND